MEGPNNRTKHVYEFVVIIIHHPPVITIFIGGINMYVYHSQSWVVFVIGLPKLVILVVIYHMSH